MFMTPWKILALWMLFLKQESYLSYINLGYRNLEYNIYTTILKNLTQKTLDEVIGDNQSTVIKNRIILHIFSTIRDVNHVSDKLNNSLALISWNFRKAVTE